MERAEHVTLVNSTTGVVEKKIMKACELAEYMRAHPEFMVFNNDPPNMSDFPTYAPPPSEEEKAEATAVEQYLNDNFQAPTRFSTGYGYNDQNKLYVFVCVPKEDLEQSQLIVRDLCLEFRWKIPVVAEAEPENIQFQIRPVERRSLFGRVMQVPKMIKVALLNPLSREVVRLTVPRNDLGKLRKENPDLLVVIDEPVHTRM